MATPTRRAPKPHHSLRQGDPRGHAFTAAHSPSICPLCQGSHGMWTATPSRQNQSTNVKVVRKASLCTNCLRKGHLVFHCPAGSCRLCGNRHHTLLHLDEAHVKNRSITTRRTFNRSPTPSLTSSSTHPSTPPTIPPSTFASEPLHNGLLFIYLLFFDYFSYRRPLCSFVSPRVFLFTTSFYNVVSRANTCASTLELSLRSWGATLC